MMWILRVAGNRPTSNGERESSALVITKQFDDHAGISERHEVVDWELDIIPTSEVRLIR